MNLVIVEPSLSNMKSYFLIALVALAAVTANGLTCPGETGCPKMVSVIMTNETIASTEKPCGCAQEMKKATIVKEIPNEKPKPCPCQEKTVAPVVVEAPKCGCCAQTVCSCCAHKESALLRGSQK